MDYIKELIKHKEKIKEIMKKSLEEEREVGVCICEDGTGISLNGESIGTEKLSIIVPETEKKVIGLFHTHIVNEPISTIDLYSAMTSGLEIMVIGIPEKNIINVYKINKKIPQPVLKVLEELDRVLEKIEDTIIENKEKIIKKQTTIRV